MNQRYDIAIIGSGPAGLSAAINAKIRNKKIILFGSKELSNKIVKAPKINNYLGLPGLTGMELKDKFKAHIDALEISINTERVNNVFSMGDYYAIMVNEKMYEAKALIIATGMEYTRPFKGELEYLGKGVGYCATCDAPLYKNKKVAIIGYNDEAAADANYVSEIANMVYYIPMNKTSVKLNESVVVVEDIPMEIVGEDIVNKLILRKQELEVDGVFVLKDSISPGQLVPGLEMENEHIKADKNMKTNLAGCFAAGDCTGKPYQYLKSAGEGLVAALKAVEYLDLELAK